MAVPSASTRLTVHVAAESARLARLRSVVREASETRPGRLTVWFARPAFRWSGAAPPAIDPEIPATSRQETKSRFMRQPPGWLKWREKETAGGPLSVEADSIAYAAGF